MFENKILEVKKSEPAKRLPKLLKRYAKELERKKRSIEEDEPNTKFYEDSERLKKIKNFAPEDTYEVWVQESHINQNFGRFLESSNTKKPKNNEELFEESASEAEDTDEAEVNEDETDEDEENFLKMERFTSDQAHFLIRKEGLEILPHIDSDHGHDNTASSKHLSNSISYSKKHTMVVSKLLHLNILRKNWKIAYKCFSLLIRIHHVDIRSIWPLGIEILTRLAEEEFLNKQPEGSYDEYKLRTNFNDQELSSQLQLFKDEQFIQWMQTFYPVNVKFKPNKKWSQLPYRIASRDTPAVYIVTLIWILIMKQNFEKVNEKLSELLLQAPYINDGTFYFLQGFSYQLEASSLSKNDNIDIQQVEKLMLDAKKFYKEAKKRNAEFPEELINKDLNLIEKRIAQGVEIERDVESSGAELEANEVQSSPIEQRHDFLSSPTSRRVRNPDSEDEEMTSFVSRDYDEFDQNILGDDSDD